MATPEDLERMRKARIPREKKRPKPIAKVSKKKQAQQKAEKKERSSEDETLKERWFKARRREMTGFCGCGCGETSSKNDDVNFRSSIAHIFPKGKDASGKPRFPSVMFDPDNWIERRFWGGCHTNMDEAGMDKWPNMEDWPQIKAKIHLLAPKLTDEERATKFYRTLEKLVYEN